MFHTLGVKPGAKYVDIGSGTGKTPALAWLLGYDATGVELSKTRYNAACKALEDLPSVPIRPPDDDCDPDFSNCEPDLRFYLDDIMNIDFSDADIVFANSVLMSNH